MGRRSVRATVSNQTHLGHEALLRLQEYPLRLAHRYV